MTFKLTLRAKLLTLIILLMTSFSCALGFYLKTHFAEVLSAELLKRGASVASHVAEICTDAFIENDLLQLEALSRKHQTTEEDIIYILMLNKDDKIIAHSFTSGYPGGLDKIRHARNNGKTSIQSIDFGGTPLFDIAAPALDARIGSVRIGISAQPVLQTVDVMIGQIILVTLALGLLSLIIALPIMQSIIRPISALTHAVKQLALRKWEQPLTVTSSDELGQLTTSFNHMASTIKKAESRLASNIHFLQVLIDDIPLPVFYKSLESKMLGCNHAYCSFWGKPKEDIVDTHTSHIYSQEDAELHLHYDKQLLEKQTPITYEHVVTDAKGLNRNIIFDKALFYDEAKQPAGIIGVMQDVSKQRRTDKMKSEFVSTVAHEFQTPLATILGFTELLQENTLNAEEKTEAFALITQKAEQLSLMVDELLDLTRIETGNGLQLQLEACDVNKAMSEIVNNFSKRTSDLSFLLQLPEENVVVSADKLRMAQVMENLLNNAVKYSELQKTIRVIVSSHEKHCQVQVVDQGIGMTSEQSRQAFEKYYRADSSNTAPPGTGLGLFITMSIIEAHKGHIEIESTQGEGTTVTFRLPKP